jgi:hypothetical protein
MIRVLGNRKRKDIERLEKKLGVMACDKRGNKHRWRAKFKLHNSGDPMTRVYKADSEREVRDIILLESGPKCRVIKISPI